MGDPRDAARLRVLRAVGGHFTGFFITAVVMVATQGHFPFWLFIWGAVLAAQAVGAAPAAWSLLRQRRAEEKARDLPAPPTAVDATPRPALASPIEQEAARVRALLAQRGGSDAARLIAEVDGILRLTADLAARQADLGEQTTEHERAAVAAAIVDARARPPPPRGRPPPASRGRLSSRTAGSSSVSSRSCRPARRRWPRPCACSTA